MLAAQQLEELEQCIVYLKMGELRELSQTLGLSILGQKRELIARIMTRVTCQELTAARPEKRVRNFVQEYSLNAHLRPDSFANGSESRQFLQREIGAHFRFTTFGMDWIRGKWTSGQIPTFREFIDFWKQEYEERKAGKVFVSKPELARVNFCRRMSKRGKPKTELETLWSQERSSRAELARSIVTEWARAAKQS